MLARISVFLLASAAFSQTLIRDVRVFDGEGLLSQVSVLIEDGHIRAISDRIDAPRAALVDGKGRTLLPGLIDARADIRSRDDLKAALRLGVTTCLDNSDPQPLAASLGGSQDPDGADLYSAGALVTVATLATAVRAAHESGKPAVVQVATGADAQEALEAGADVLVHVPEGVFDTRRIRGAAWVPTLALMAAAAQEDQRPVLFESVRRIHQAGANILAGTSASPPGAAQAASLHDEMAVLVKAGLTPLQALAAATSRPANVFRLAGRGRIIVGHRADLVLVEGDPSVDITTTRRIVKVWKNGIAR